MNNPNLGLQDKLLSSLSRVIKAARFAHLAVSLPYCRPVSATGAATLATHRAAALSSVLPVLGNVFLEREKDPPAFPFNSGTQVPLM